MIYILNLWGFLSDIWEMYAEFKSAVFRQKMNIKNVINYVFLL